MAVVGAGAVGSYFGGLLARAGAPVTLIARPAHADAINRNGLRLDTLKGDFRVDVAATSDFAAVSSAQIVLVAVKTPDTERTAAALAPLLRKDAIVLSMQNGVDNVERMHRAAGISAFGAAVYVAVQVTAPGVVKHTGRGDLVIGDPLAEAGAFPARPAGLATLEKCFSAASIPCRVAENIRADLWTKLAMNCAYNAVSALTAERYGTVMRDPAVHEVMKGVLDETIAVAAKTGVTLSREVLLETARRLGEAMIDALSSTAQDLLQGKPTEIDSLNGLVADLGKQHGVDTPVNRTLHALVKLAEKVRVETPGPRSSR